MFLFTPERITANIYLRYYIYFTPFHSTEIANSTVLGASQNSSAVLNVLLL